MKPMLVILIALLSSACVSARIPEPQKQLVPADLLLTGGKIFTGVAGQSFVEAVAIRGDSIIATGSAAELKSLAGPATRVIQLEGRLVVPGINDAHVHEPWSLQNAMPVRIPEEGATKETLLIALRAAVAAAPPAMMLTAGLPRGLFDAGLTRSDLDSLSNSVPIRIDNFGGHSSLLNTAALRAFDIAEDAMDIPGGWYGRDGGRLNGWVYEHALWIPQARMAERTGDDEIRAELLAFEDEVLRYGVTSVQTMPVIAAARLEKVLASMSPRLRWRIIDFRLAPYPGPPSRFPVKYVLDGTPIERSAATRLAYADDATGRGSLNYSDEEIRSIVRDAAKGVQPLLVHAVGDRAIGSLLDAMKATSADWPSLRVRIEHGDMIDAAQIDDARKLGVVLVQNPAHFTIPDLMHPRFGPSRMKIAQPARSLIENKNRFAIGSDGPLNPFLNMFFAAIHPVNPAESLTVEQSLLAYTREAAFAEFEEKRKGTVAPGMLADLAVLSHDIFAIPVQQLPGVSSDITIVGGRIVWERAEGAN